MGWFVQRETYPKFFEIRNDCMQNSGNVTWLVSLLIRKIWWRCHENSITCYLIYSCYINTNSRRFTCLHFSHLPIGPIRSRGRCESSHQPIKGKDSDFFFSLLLWVVRLKSDKYQPEHLTSVSHFKRTTVEATFGQRLD